jgi:hypothetical protein
LLALLRVHHILHVSGIRVYELKKKIGKVFTSKFVETGPSSYEKRIYRTAVSQMLRNAGLEGSGYAMDKN